MCVKALFTRNVCIWVCVKRHEWGPWQKVMRCSQLTVLLFQEQHSKDQRKIKMQTLRVNGPSALLTILKIFPWKRILLHLFHTFNFHLFSKHTSAVFLILWKCTHDKALNATVIWQTRNSGESGDTHFWKPWIFLWRRVGGDTSWRRWRGSRWSAISRADDLCTLAPKKHKDNSMLFMVLINCWLV